MNYFKVLVCNYFKWDFYTEDRAFEDWFFLYLSVMMTEVDDLHNVRIPLAELPGEIAGGLFNPEGLKKYFAMKKHRQDAFQSGMSIGKDGGFVSATTSLEGDKLIDSGTGEEIMSVDELDKLLMKFQ